jgi:formate hydrogenlyase subunit 3/multisubunit Na+/H+ antiporter MnhD subunit
MLMLAAFSSPRLRATTPSLLAFAPVPALAAALSTGGNASLALPKWLFGATFVLDEPGAILLGAAAILWIAAGAYVRAEKRRGAPFTIWWLLALIGNVGIFIAADVATFYLFFAVGSLSAYGLISHDDTPDARRAGIVYVALALFGEACVLMGLVLLTAAAPEGTLDIRALVAALPQSPWQGPAMACFIAGFGLKIALVPMHVWMPLAYTAAPIPAAAVLSGAAVKAGVIGFLRFLPFDAGSEDWGTLLAAVGLVSAFYGVAVGLTQRDPKAILAYSSASQMGLIAAIIGMGLAAKQPHTAMAVSFYAANHILVKGALFLAIGAAAVTWSRRWQQLLLPAAILALGLAGLSFTGGGLAKLAVKPTLGDGLVGTLASLAAVGSAILMLHFLACIADVRAVARQHTPAASLIHPWLGLAVASIVVPWVLFPFASRAGYADVFSGYGIWSTLWPVVLGVLIAAVLRRWRQRLPALPVGDIVVPLQKRMYAASGYGAILDGIDRTMRSWSFASGCLLTLALALLAALAGGG